MKLRPITLVFSLTLLTLGPGCLELVTSAEDAIDGATDGGCEDDDDGCEDDDDDDDDCDD